jgi:hypothetical protein
MSAHAGQPRKRIVDVTAHTQQAVLMPIDSSRHTQPACMRNANKNDDKRNGIQSYLIFSSFYPLYPAGQQRQNKKCPPATTYNNRQPTRTSRSSWCGESEGTAARGWAERVLWRAAMCFDEQMGMGIGTSPEHDQNQASKPPKSTSETKDQGWTKCGEIKRPKTNVTHISPRKPKKQNSIQSERPRTPHSCRSVALAVCSWQTPTWKEYGRRTPPAPRGR